MSNVRKSLHTPSKRYFQLVLLKIFPIFFFPIELYKSLVTIQVWEMTYQSHSFCIAKKKLAGEQGCFTFLSPRLLCNMIIFLTEKVIKGPSLNYLFFLTVKMWQAACVTAFFSPPSPNSTYLEQTWQIIILVLLQLKGQSVRWTVL